MFRWWMWYQEKSILKKNIASGTLYILTEILGVAHSFVHVIAISYTCFVRWKVFSRKSCLGIVLHVSVFKRMQRSRNFLLFSPDISISPLTTWIVSFQVINFFLVHKNYDFFVLRTALKQKKITKKNSTNTEIERQKKKKWKENTCCAMATPFLSLTMINS